jgi:hypothetical protein
MFFAGGSFTYPDLIHFPPRRYRELYRTESQEQARISDYTIAQEPLRSADNFGWRVTSTIEGRDTVSDITVLTWSDLVKSSMERGVLWTYLSLFKTAWFYIGSGALRDVMKLRKGPVIAALYPVGFLIAQLCFAILCAAVLSSVLWPMHPVFGIASWGIIWPILALFQKYDGKIFAHYLMQDYAHTARHRGAYDPELSTRLDAFGHSIEQALSQGYDEVLVVGHSSGAHLGVSVLARLERAGVVTQKSPVSFLSLGHVVPMVSFLPAAKELRSDLKQLGNSDAVTWVDVTAPGDGCSFALCDPVAVSGQGDGTQNGPLVLSAAFTQTLSDARWRALRWRFFRLHFQYLCAFDRPGFYDYFQITAGPHTLPDRFQGRAPSPSRIVVQTTRYGGAQ